MKIFVYSDESGVLDKLHNDYYVFGGLLFFSEEDQQSYSRQYIAAEKNVRISESINPSDELKASKIKPKSRNKLYRSIMEVERFGMVISQKQLKDGLFSNKKTKQRYLDWAYKMAIKKKLERLVNDGIIIPDDVESITFQVDEHSTATNGRYELRESIEQELKIGTWNFEYQTFYKPLFPKIKSVNLQYCNSAKKTLVRAADIVANHIFFYANKNGGVIPTEQKLNIYYHSPGMAQ